MSMRIAVTGVNGQVARSLQRLAPGEVEIVAIGRPVLDLTRSETIAASIADAKPNAIINAAAYTAVDDAESDPAAAFAINESGARAVAEAAAAHGVPIVQMSTDYVFDGVKQSPYVETDATAPLSVYGASKLAGELAVAATQPDHVILRVSWIYSSFGANFVRTMLRLAEVRDEIAVVDDQHGAPTSADDVARALVSIATHLVQRPEERDLRGVFHLSPDGDASWADVAEAIFAQSAMRGGPRARVRRIPSADYPTAAKRPHNSRLDGAKLTARYSIQLPHWRTSLAECVDDLLRPAEINSL